MPHHFTGIVDFAMFTCGQSEALSVARRSFARAVNAN